MSKEDCEWQTNQTRTLTFINQEMQERITGWVMYDGYIDSVKQSLVMVRNQTPVLRSLKEKNI